MYASTSEKRISSLPWWLTILFAPAPLLGSDGPQLGFLQAIRPRAPERRSSRLLNPRLPSEGKLRAPNPTRTRAASAGANSSSSASTFGASPAMAEPEVEVAAAANAAMEIEAPAAAGQKRVREEGGDPAAEGGEAEAAKKPKVEEATKEKKEADEGKGEEEEDADDDEEEGVQAEEGKGEEVEVKPVKLGPKEFASGVEMFDYFFALLHSWSPQLEFNKYEQMVLEDLLKKGHAEPSKKIGTGIKAFEIRSHPIWRSRCFFVCRVDGSTDDFSFRKCVDNILPLPEDMKIGTGKKSGGGHHKGGGRGQGGGRGGGRGGWRGGRGRGRRGG